MLDRRTDASLQNGQACAGEAAGVRAGARQSMLAPFRIRSFRYQWPADLLTSWAFEMETVILGWYVLAETKSVVWLSVFGALQFLGALVAPVFGVAGDRLGHRSLLFSMRAVYSVIAGTIMILAATGLVTPLVVLICATLTGIVRPSDLGIRGAFIAETIPAESLISAMSVSRTTTDSARVAGALAGASLFGLFGMATAYVIVTGFYLVGTLLMLGDTEPMRRASVALAPEDLSSPWRDFKDGMAQVWNTPALAAMVSIAFLTNLTAFPISHGLLPYVARNIYALDQTALGYLVASFAGGALIGSIGLGHIGGRAHLARMTIFATLVWYVLLLAFAQMPGPVGGFICLLLAGFAQSLSIIALTIILLRESDERFRGRVMGVRMLAIYGLPLGLLAAGPLIDLIGFRPMASLYAIAGLACTLLIALRWRAQLWRA